MTTPAPPHLDQSARHDQALADETPIPGSTVEVEHDCILDGDRYATRHRAPVVVKSILAASDGTIYWLGTRCDGKHMAATWVPADGDRVVRTPGGGL